jgi:hypothetical protein
MVTLKIHRIFLKEENMTMNDYVTLCGGLKIFRKLLRNLKIKQLLRLTIFQNIKNLINFLTP